MRIYIASLLAGMRNKDIDMLIKQGKPKYLLNTYYEGEDACLKVLDIAGTDNFLLDSGAFSYMSGAKCDETIIEKYAENYAYFIKRNNIKNYFELDVDTIFGIEFVEQIRHKIEDITGVCSIPVWHKGRGVDYFKKMCEEYKYIAIGGLVFHVRQQEYPLIKKLVEYAYNKGIKVHGLGFTKTKELENWHWYSVDSTSWKTSAIRGSTRQLFNGKYIEPHIIKSNYKVDQRLLATFNCIEWCKYQRYMEGK